MSQKPPLTPSSQHTTKPSKKTPKYIQVAVRVKPTHKHRPRCLSITSPQTLTLHPSPLTGPAKNFKFQYCFPDSSTQRLIYDSLKGPLLSTAWEGCNCSVFSYGEGQSGKTYTLYGNMKQDTDDTAGIVPRFLNDLFDEIHRKKQLKRARGISLAQNSAQNDQERYKVIISMVEVRNEKVYDVLNPNNPENGMGLKIREHPQFGPYAPALSLFDVRDAKEALRMVRKAQKKNPKGHTILQVILTQTRFNWERKEAATDVVSRINLVDLGAPERLDTTKDYQKETVQAGTSINLTLATLGLVITKLSEQSKETLNASLGVAANGTPGSPAAAASNNASTPNRRTSLSNTFVPYRDSALTWLLRESLGGNSFTMVLACILPGEKHALQTLGTLRFANRAALVTNRLKVNVHANENILQELKREVALLHKMLSKFGSNPEDLDPVQQEEYLRIKEELEDTKFLTETVQQTPEERKVTFERKRVEALDKLKSGGISGQDISEILQIPASDLPYLLSLNTRKLEDKIIFFLQNPESHLGSSSRGDIVVTGPSIRPKHALLTCSEDHSTVSISPVGDAPVFVNGVRIAEGASEALNIYDRIVVGDFGFRFHPKESVLQQQQTHNQKVEQSLMDWEKAKKEYIQKRTEDLEKRLMDILPLENKLEKMAHDVEEKQFLKDELLCEIEELERRRIEKQSEVDEIEAQNSGVWTWCCWLWCWPVMCVGRKKKSSKQVKPEAKDSKKKAAEPLVDAHGKKRQRDTQQMTSAATPPTSGNALDFSFESVHDEDVTPSSTTPVERISGGSFRAQPNKTKEGAINATEDEFIDISKTEMRED